MKSIVVCESTLVEQQEEPAKLPNGNSESTKSEKMVNNHEKEGKRVRNGDDTCSEEIVIDCEKDSNDATNLTEVKSAENDEAVKNAVTGQVTSSNGDSKCEHSTTDLDAEKHCGAEYPEESRQVSLEGSSAGFQECSDKNEVKKKCDKVVEECSEAEEVEKSSDIEVIEKTEDEEEEDEKNKTEVDFKVDEVSFNGEVKLKDKQKDDICVVLDTREDNVENKRPEWVEMEKVWKKDDEVVSIDETDEEKDDEKVEELKVKVDKCKQVVEDNEKRSGNVALTENDSFDDMCVVLDASEGDCEDKDENKSNMVKELKIEEVKSEKDGEDKGDREKNAGKKSEDKPENLKESFDSEIEVEDNGQHEVDNMEDVLSDGDGNKENEKDSKEGFPDNSEDAGENGLHENSNSCQIQVGECQTISDSEKDSIWIVEEGRKSLEETSWTPEQEKTPEVCKVDGSKDEIMEIEAEQTTGHSEGEAEGEVKENAQTETDSDMEECIGSDVVSTRKRPPSGSDNESAKKKKKPDEEGSEEECCVTVEDEGTTNESKTSEGSFPASQNTANPTVNEQPQQNEQQQTSSQEAEAAATKKRTLMDDRKPKKVKTYAPTAEVGKLKTTSSFLANLRGTLKSLTRSDLEELIVQKLCEVITERSTVGELRRKAQVLEQSQERWKEKVQSLTKQMREMEMVMKRYINEVQIQKKEGNGQLVIPMKMTRSVGLQVPFCSNVSKLPKPSNPTQNQSTSSPVQTVNGRNVKVAASNTSPPQINIISPNVRNKTANLSQKNSNSSPKPPTPIQPKKTPVQRVECSPYIVPQNTSVVPQSLLNNNRLVQSQPPPIRPYKPVTTIQPIPQQPQPIQQNGSKVIDLTDDDERQPSTKTTYQGSVVKASSNPIRVVNHLQQSPVFQSNRVTYIVPTTSTAPTGTSGAQSRHFFIPAPPPDRNFLYSTPALPYNNKRGNANQSGPQPQMLNQANRVISPKPLRHPAPLPQPSFNQINRPNLKLLPPRPALKISKVQTGIVLSWNMTLGPEYAPISSYQLYAYQEGNSPPATSLWKKVGDVKALPLPMACTLTQFMSGHKYHFAVRAVDLHSRIGPFSFPGAIVLVK